MGDKQALQPVLDAIHHLVDELGEGPGDRPVHETTLWLVIAALGLNLLDNLALDEVAATAAKLQRWEFMLVVAPLRMENGAGSPVNVIATF